MSIITEAELRLMAVESAIQVALTSLTDSKRRITAIEARCHELEHDRAASVQEQIVDIQERVGALEAMTGATTAEYAWVDDGRVHVIPRDAPSEVRYAPVDDHRDTERPVQPAPELVVVQCESAQSCQYPCGLRPGYLSHRAPHERTEACRLPCRGGGSRCIPVPASPEVAIPDVPVQVGTEAFREALAGHMEELSQGYGYRGRMDAALMGVESWEHLASVACTLRDAYELARTGKTEAAEEKLKEITW